MYEVTQRNSYDTIYQEIKSIFDHKSKPIDGFGDFEEVICKIGAIQKTLHPSIKKRVALIACGDHGIVEEGVSQSDCKVTRLVAESLGKGQSTASTLGKAIHCDILPVDVGIYGKEEIPGVVSCKIAEGTKNFKISQAMTMSQCREAIDLGKSLARDASKKGYELIVTGEMGIGNTTASTAILLSLLDVPKTQWSQYIGRGAGLDDQRFIKKQQVIEEGLRLHQPLIQSQESQSQKALMALCCFGGLEIACMVGMFLGGKEMGIPVVLDGLISATAALVASRLETDLTRYILPSHQGREGGCMLALKALGLTPLLRGNMALGEGTGGLLLLPLLDSMISYYEQGASFFDNHIEDYMRYESGKGQE
ncbi:MAG: nicotinate-nucleotide--dimethylbenzimidazole phosphoribosyltransferase [Lachnospiraceae bacterium]|nr:nicotinate-nucleotide--dimethylbenzimidazole phosphoribosyltransferase [Lachnospiraceae bacterium]